jgi:hypothetical protein
MFTNILPTSVSCTQGDVLLDNCVKVMSDILDAKHISFLKYIDNTLRPIYGSTGGLLDLFYVIGHYYCELESSLCSTIKKILDYMITTNNNNEPILSLSYFDNMENSMRLQLRHGLDEYSELRKAYDHLMAAFLEKANYAIVNNFRSGDVIFEVNLDSLFPSAIGDARQQLFMTPPTNKADILNRKLDDDILLAANSDNLFLLCGEIWLIRYKRGKLIALQNSMGLRYIELLIGHSHKEFVVMDMIRFIRQEIGMTKKEIYGKYSDSLSFPTNKESDALMDPQYIIELRNELEILNNKLLIAKESNNTEDIESNTMQIAILDNSMKEARKAFNRPIDNARTGINTLIKYAIGKIRKNEQKDLADHLTRYISPGYECSYSLPDTFSGLEIWKY